MRRGSQLQVVPPNAVDYWGLTFDRDSAYVYATVWEWDKIHAALIRVPVLGGDVVHVLDEAGAVMAAEPRR